jgi:hypothetical protein
MIKAHEAKVLKKKPVVTKPEPVKATKKDK